MMLREGHVVLRDPRGTKTALTETKDAGYYARFDDRTWVLFMNDKQRRIVIYDATTKALDTMAVGANTAPFRVPGKRAVTFVASEPFPAPEGRRRRAHRASSFCGSSISTTVTSPRSPRFLSPPRGATSGRHEERC